MDPFDFENRPYRARRHGREGPRGRGRGRGRCWTSGLRGAATAPPANSQFDLVGTGRGWHVPAPWPGILHLSRLESPCCCPRNQRPPVLEFATLFPAACCLLRPALSSPLDETGDSHRICQHGFWQADWASRHHSNGRLTRGWHVGIPPGLASLFYFNCHMVWAGQL